MIDPAWIAALGVILFGVGLLGTFWGLLEVVQDVGDAVATVSANTTGDVDAAALAASGSSIGADVSGSSPVSSPDSCAAGEGKEGTLLHAHEVVGRKGRTIPRGPTSY